MLCINGLFLHLFCSTWINLNDCDDMITLPLINIMYMSLWYLYIVYDSMPNGYVIVSAKYVNLWILLNVIVKSGLVKSLLRDPSLEENTSFFLKWFCCYLGVYLLQPGYILSANTIHKNHIVNLKTKSTLMKQDLIT